METTNNTKKRKNGKFGLTLAALVLLSIFLLRLPAGQIAGAQPPGDQPRTRFAITDLGTLATSFSGSPHNEATAVLTFFNEATTTESFSDGPLRVIDRDGTTTIYLNTATASFANPDSFRSGILIQTSTLHQQAIADTVAGTFTAVFANTISSTSEFTINGTTFRLGQTGQAFRATVTGQGNPTPPPTGYFGGYAVGVGEEYRSVGRSVGRPLEPSDWPGLRR